MDNHCLADSQLSCEPIFTELVGVMGHRPRKDPLILGKIQIFFSLKSPACCLTLTSLEVYTLWVTFQFQSIFASQPFVITKEITVCLLWKKKCNKEDLSNIMFLLSWIYLVRAEGWFVIIPELSSLWVVNSRLVSLMIRVPSAIYSWSFRP